ncbi:tumor necrosis factor receptor superfamily member 10B-like isoform X2 [Choloepus didactylus]|uniref:tumor necrosis factor receptor superfamily member 10B-like isoform X2 n=1 Tax=Choloepus didactylus TaxID=27675 RepID=UPI00189F0529|nr:tumor necrosis factor receptor superfamily member 10B-like isoform X2 [Choloepus didactylus]
MVERHGTLRNITAQRGQSAPHASGTGVRARPGAGAGSVPGPRLAVGRRPRLRRSGRVLLGPLILLFAAICVRLPVFADSAPITEQLKAHGHVAAAQRSELAPLKGLCPPGSHVSEDGRNCTLCQSGVEYTSHSNALSSCLPCTVCKPDEDEMSPCTRTRDAQCQCKPGTFSGEDVPEFCQKCKARCPKGMVEAHPCTPWGDVECVHQGSGVLSIVIGSVVALVILVILGVCVFIPWKRCTCQGCGEDSKCLARVMMNSWHFPRGSGAQDNARNQMLSPSQTTLDSAQENQGPEQAELPGATARNPVEAEPLLERGTSPVDAEPLLGQDKAQESQRKMVLVPANGADPTETLKSFFNICQDFVPFNSWTRLMRLLGLTDNEIAVARADAASTEEGFYNMLDKWLSTKGRDASVNSLLDALETLGERNAKERIQKYLVDSRRYISQEHTADTLGYVYGNGKIASGNQSFTC